jgi:hypothetical protein
MVGLVAGVDSKQINNDRLSSLKTWIITTNSVWILVLVAHIIFYEINLFGNIWIWIALFGADFVLPLRVVILFRTFMLRSRIHSLRH